MPGIIHNGCLHAEIFSSLNLMPGIIKCPLLAELSSLYFILVLMYKITAIYLLVANSSFSSQVFLAGRNVLVAESYVLYMSIACRNVLVTKS